MMSPIFNRNYPLRSMRYKTLTFCTMVAFLVGLPPSPVVRAALAPTATTRSSLAVGLPIQVAEALSVSQPAVAKHESTAVAAAATVRTATNHGPASIQGLVYSDVNANGVKELAEVGVGHVTVTAYDTTGTAIANTSTATETGQYTLRNLPANTPLRLEFTTLPAGSQPGAHNLAAGAGIQLVTTTSGALDNINVGMRVPADYCQSNPQICSTLFLTALQNAMLTLAYRMSADTIHAAYSHASQHNTQGGDQLTNGITVREQADAPVASQAGFVQFGDRAWLESDADGLLVTGVITPVAGLLITATNGTQVYTATTTPQGYYSFTVEAGTYTVTYGSIPQAYGTVVASEAPGGNQASGNAGHYQEPGKPDQNHANGTVVTLTDGQANWQIDFVFHAPQSALRLVKQVTPQVATAGDPLTYTLQVINDGPDTATDVQVQDFLPATVAYQSATPQQGVYDVATGRWDVGTVLVGSSVTLTITVTVK